MVRIACSRDCHWNSDWTVEPDLFQRGVCVCVSRNTQMGPLGACVGCHHTPSQDGITCCHWMKLLLQDDIKSVGHVEFHPEYDCEK